MTKAVNIFLTFFLCTGVLTSSAQNLVYTPAQDVSGQISGDIVEYNINVNTPSTEAITYKWETIENTFKDDWDCSLCDYGGCYPSVPDSGKMVRIKMAEAQDDKTGFFKINFLSSTTTGIGVLKIYVYDSANYSRGDTISFTMEYAQPSSVKNPTSIPLIIHPNPANTIVSFETSTANNLMTLSDLQGRILKEKNVLNTGTHPLTIADLPSGVYFLKLNSSGVIRQSKLIIRH
jgi:hypothetical protein